MQPCVVCEEMGLLRIFSSDCDFALFDCSGFATSPWAEDAYYSCLWFVRQQFSDDRRQTRVRTEAVYLRGLIFDEGERLNRDALFRIIDHSTPCPEPGRGYAISNRCLTAANSLQLARGLQHNIR